MTREAETPPQAGTARAQPRRSAERRLRLVAPLALLCLIGTGLGAPAADAQGAGTVTAEKPRLRGPDIGFPSVRRVLLGFGVCAVLAVGVVVLLRRYWPGIAPIRTETGAVRVVERARLDASLRVHVVEAGGTRLLVAEGKSGVAVCILPPSPPPPS